jgi:hypothetical protein
MKKLLLEKKDQLNEKQIAQARIGLAIKNGKEHSKGTKKTSKSEVIAIRDNARFKRVKAKWKAPSSKIKTGCK